ncbi:MAG: hypothetical protein JW915_18585 [Chitinispirillaceae bacterium]|nr:hypothetical protein [Chitinispirillaceae bacterium]
MSFLIRHIYDMRLVLCYLIFVLITVLTGQCNSELKSSATGKLKEGNISSNAKNSDNNNKMIIKEHKMNSSQWMAALCSSQGDHYVKLREALLLDSMALEEFLSKKPSASDTSNTEIHYEIISGWKNNGEKFKNYLSEIESIDFETEKKKVTGVPGVWRAYANKAKREYGELIIPLCWEVLLKHGREWESWVINIFLTAIEYIPDHKSIGPLIQYMDVTTDLPQHRFAGAKLGYLVSSLSIPDINEHLEVIKLKHASIIEGIDEALSVIKSEEKRKR